MSAVKRPLVVGLLGFRVMVRRVGGVGAGRTRAVCTEKDLPISGKAEVVSTATISHLSVLPTSSVAGQYRRSLLTCSVPQGC